MIRVAFFMIVAITVFSIVKSIIFDTVNRSEEELCVRYEQREVQRLKKVDGMQYINKELVEYCAEKVYPFH
jgi:hypothetical protein